jgi:PadR family transcriptional regulator PadR
MSKRGYLGEMELMALLAVMRLGEEAYGVPNSKELLILAREKSPSAAFTQRWTDWNRKVLYLRRLATRHPSAAAARSAISMVTGTGLRALK